MWGEGILGRATRKMTARAVGGRLEKLAERIRANGGAAVAIVLPDGTRVDFGAEPKIVLTVRDEATLAALAQPTLGTLGEAFIEARLDIDGDMLDALAVADRLASEAGASVSARFALLLGRHPLKQDRGDVQYHYDVGNEFYRLWLDQRMVYSCAYFKTGTESIDQAQRDKLDHICRKLRLAPGERLLDIGCGWGGLVLHAAQHYGVGAVGITLSTNQLALARERVQALGLAEQVEILQLDYRELPERFGAASFDKVASIGMFEHVGLRNLPLYFGTVARVLRERGLFLNHGITSSDVDNRPVGSGAGDFVSKYVFPHGELPHLHVAVREMSAQALEVFDVESLRPHYARTLQHWSQQLESRLAEAAQTVADRTLRIWRAYLAGCSYGFVQGWMNIYQVLASKQTEAGPTALPLTRDWLYR
jgi:cyclopropane-fatty-acyl-phospholipid synthase